MVLPSISYLCNYSEYSDAEEISSVQYTKERQIVCVYVCVCVLIRPTPTEGDTDLHNIQKKIHKMERHWTNKRKYTDSRATDQSDSSTLRSGSDIDDEWTDRLFLPAAYLLCFSWKALTLLKH